MPNKTTTICACASRPFIDKNKVAKLATILKHAGYEVNIVPDLCKMVMQKSPLLNDISKSTIIACHPRAVNALFSTIQLAVNQVLDIRNKEYKDILEQLGVADNEALNDDEAKKQIEAFDIENGTDAWFPTIDKHRCVECGKCHDFCLFGVYDITDGLVEVVQPQNCKNNCPACARMCPSRAIVFPKYEKSPINGGLTDEEIITNDAKELYNNELRRRLEQRRASVLLIKDNKKPSDITFKLPSNK